MSKPKAEEGRKSKSKAGKGRSTNLKLDIWRG
jgi:hypothetical protein